MYLLTLLVEDLVRLVRLGVHVNKTVCQFEKKRLHLKVHASNKKLLSLEFVNETYNLY